MLVPDVRLSSASCTDTRTMLTYWTSVDKRCEFRGGGGVIYLYMYMHAAGVYIHNTYTYIYIYIC